MRACSTRDCASGPSGSSVAPRSATKSCSTRFDPGAEARGVPPSVRRRHPASLDPYPRRHAWYPASDRRPARPGRPVVLLRVLPAQGRGRRGRAVALDPRAGAAAAHVRLGHLRRRRYDARPHDRDHVTDRPRDHAAPDGSPDLRRPHHRRAHRDPGLAGRVRSRQRAGAARRPGRRPGDAVGPHRRRHRLRLRAGGVHPVGG